MPVDKSAPRVRRMFGEIAPRYDLLNHLLSLGIDRRWRRRATRLAPPDGEGLFTASLQTVRVFTPG